MHSEHTPFIPGPGNSGTDQTGTGYRDPEPDNTGLTGYTGSDQVQLTTQGAPITPGAPVTPGESVTGNTGTSHTGTQYPVPVPSNIGCTGYTGSDQAQPVTPGAMVTPGDPSLGTLLQIDPLGLGPTPPGPSLGIWLVSMGFRLRPLT